MYRYIFSNSALSGMLLALPPSWRPHFDVFALRGYRDSRVRTFFNCMTCRRWRTVSLSRRHSLREPPKRSKRAVKTEMRTSWSFVVCSLCTAISNLAIDRQRAFLTVLPVLRAVLVVSNVGRLSLIYCAYRATRHRAEVPNRSLLNLTTSCLVHLLSALSLLPTASFDSCALSFSSIYHFRASSHTRHPSVDSTFQRFFYSLS